MRNLPSPRSIASVRGTMLPVGRFGPAGLPSAVVLTIDNLGEARALERGARTGRAARERPVGDRGAAVAARHARRPWVDAPRSSSRRSTASCIRTRSARSRRAATGSGSTAGATRSGDRCPAADERDILTRAVEAFSALGLEARGFRPPGGELNSRTPALLRAAGLRWCSPAGGTAGVRHRAGLRPVRLGHGRRVSPDGQLRSAPHLARRPRGVARAGRARRPLGGGARRSGQHRQPCERWSCTRS